MSWDVPHSPPFNVQNNVPDYQKMLQNNAALSSGWSSRDTARYDTAGSYSRSKSPLSNTSRPMLGSGLSFPDSRSPYQSYRPSKYGLSATTYDQTYLNRDFNELSIDDTHANNDQNVERADNSVRNVFDYDKYAKNGDIYGRSSKYGSYMGQRSSSDNITSGYDRIASSDNLWTSPPKRTSPLDLPSSVFKSHPRGQSVLTDPYTNNFSADKAAKPPISGSNAFEDKYFSDNDIVTRGNKSRPSSNLYGGSSAGMRQWQREQYPTLSQDKYSKAVNGGFSAAYKSTGDPDDQRWGTLSHSADDAIREKDQIIDKLKMKVMQLEEDNKKFEVKLKHAVMNGEGDGETYKQIQELEYKNAELKSELADLRSKKQSEMENLEIKLGATEEEVNQLRSALRKMAPGSDEIESQFYQLEQEREEWKQKFIEMREDNTQMKGKLDELQTYLSDLPTMEETVKNNKQLQHLREQEGELKLQISELQQRLFDNKKKLTTRDMQIHELESKISRSSVNERQLAEQVSIVTEEIERLKSEGEGATLQRCEEELDTVRKENGRLALDLEKAKKLLETSHRKVRHIEAKHHTDIRHYQERLAHEEESVEGMREEGRQKDEQMNKLKKSMKELSNHNQDLMEQLLIVKEELKKFEHLASDDNIKLQKKFTREMSACYTELQSLVQVCVQRAEGKDPNMSMLLGIKSSPVDLQSGAGACEKDAQTVLQWLTKVQELREEIEGLRQLVCNKYAEELGNNLSCATQ